MTDDELRTAHRAAVAVAGRVRLPLGSRVWKGRAGEFAGAGSGASLDFQDHRDYLPGDDPRHINWQAYARTGHHTMKLFREEVRPVVELVVDVSESMFFDAAKARRTAELAFLVARSAAACGASVRAHALRGEAAQMVDPRALAGHRWLEDARAAAAAGDPAATPDAGRVELRANSVRVLLSDLLFPGDPEDMLRKLVGRGGSLLVLAPFLESEAAPEWAGNCELVDVERGTRHPERIEPAALARFREAYANHFSFWRQAAARHRAPLARIPSAPDFAAAVIRHAVPAGVFEPRSS